MRRNVQGGNALLLLTKTAELGNFTENNKNKRDSIFCSSLSYTSLTSGELECVPIIKFDGKYSSMVDRSNDSLL